MLNQEPIKKDIVEAHERIKNQIHKTPLLTSESLNKIFGCELYFKCENFQKVGAFKFRGASNAVLSLDKNELEKGVITHSSGNHAAALSLAAKMKNVPAYIVMPVTAPEIKKRAVAGYGAQITFSEPTVKSREEAARKIVAETGATFIHPYDNYAIIAGQATCAKEMLEDVADLDYIISPVGGAGLASGTCLSANYFSNYTKVIGAEPKGADDAFRSLRDKTIYPSINPKTICDGLLTQLCDKTYLILTKYLNDLITVDDETTIRAMKIIWERMKIIVEPSSAITLGAVMDNPDKFRNKKIGLILSGGNVDLDKLPWLNNN
ncbi:MAG: pyridoxal-phosphate dependent enzyme [Ignavibacteria bacterium]|nr:pyridoxal-phosphate dependent enzyme [Ignavibacteria bacterium]